ncbi:hypothetical protein IQ255_30885 [Pleurocapsales cyanobacterium LEGE 10410]|nr:hypothetical protein [Pleurocapsales cyanobacterium LEGE 10410]
MALEIIIPIAAVVILFFLFTWMLNVFKVTIKTLLVIVAILLLLQIALGINSLEVVQEMIRIVESILQLITGN